VAFVPYARPSGLSHDEYTRRARQKFEQIGLELRGIHEHEDPAEAIKSASAIFIGGGNTFLLLGDMYENGIVQAVRDAVESGVSYMGTSAGSNVAGMTIGTTNDMPIVYPPSFDALSLVPFNINPHYIDPNPDSKHMGESRETRINEFHVLNDQPVVGLREGAWLHVVDDSMKLEGTGGARLFRPRKDPVEIASDTDVSHLL